MLKRFISTTVGISIVYSLFKIPKKYKKDPTKKVHQRIRNHINENQDTSCCFF